MKNKFDSSNVIKTIRKIICDSITGITTEEMRKQIQENPDITIEELTINDNPELEKLYNELGLTKQTFIKLATEIKQGKHR